VGIGVTSKVIFGFCHLFFDGAHYFDCQLFKDYHQESSLSFCDGKEIL
jgi:hypothetical protein